MSDRWSSAWSALHHRDFRLLWGATFISNAGSWMQKVATSWLVYQMTGSKAWLGVEAFALPVRNPLTCDQLFMAGFDRGS